MKKLIFIFLFCLFSFTAFSEEFALFPWFCNQKDIYTFCMNKGWKYTDSSEKNMKAFSIKPTENVTYYNTEISNILFQFDKDGSVVSQNITFNNLVDTASSFATVLQYAIADKATLIDYKIENNDYIFIRISGNIRDACSVDYVIYGQNNAYQLSISYHTY